MVAVVAGVIGVPGQRADVHGGPQSAGGILPGHQREWATMLLALTLAGWWALLRPCYRLTTHHASILWRACATSGSKLQTMAIPISYNIRNLKLRKGLTIMTALGIALTVTTVVFLMALLAGLKQAFVTSGDP